MNKNKVKEGSNSSKFQLKDAEFVSEFPGVLKCAAECKNGIATEYDLHDVSQYLGDVGMCQIYKGEHGYFAVFFSSDLSIITTAQGIYTHYNMFHSIRGDKCLFVFEENFAKYEEATCIMIDIVEGYNRLKQVQMIHDMLDFVHGQFFEEEE